MCGIAGIFAYNYAANPVDRAALLRIRDRMAARGPDGSGEWLSDDRRVGFGHQRLSIIDLGPTGLQPMASADGRLVVTFNGEIFNYRILRKDLEAKGCVFRSQSDTEVLLHLYAERGPDMLRALRGMFALAIWDHAEQRLFLARDPYGIKPLYCADDGWTFRFASQVKALLADSRVATDPEPAGVVGFHLYGSVPEPFTLYRAIRALPAGHSQIVDATGPHPPQCYANLAAILAEGARRPAPQTELAQRVREAARDSVAAHLVADVEVGLFLSAGIDSGAVTGLVRDAGHADVRAITLGFEEFRGTANDEMPLAAQVARRYGARHVVRRIGEREFLNDLPAILEAMDQPSIDGVNTWFVAKAAREAGLKVALSGLGGDELLAGYPSFRELPVWRRRLGPLSAIPGLGRLTRSIIGTIAPAAARARPKLLGLLEHGHGWSGVYLLRRGLYLPNELNSILDADLVREGLRRLDPLGRLEASLVPDPGSDTGRVCALESRSYMLNQLLRDADWAGMAHGVEIRVPLVDIELTRKLAPSIATMLPGEGKAALAKAPAQPLPDEIVNRPKSGFLVPTGAWMSALANKQSTIPAHSSLGTVSRAWARLIMSKATGEWHEARAA